MVILVDAATATTAQTAAAASATQQQLQKVRRLHLRRTQLLLKRTLQALLPLQRLKRQRQVRQQERGNFSSNGNNQSIRGKHICNCNGSFSFIGCSSSRRRNVEVTTSDTTAALDNKLGVSVD